MVFHRRRLLGVGRPAIVISAGFTGPTDVAGSAPVFFWGLSPHSAAYASGGGKAIQITDNASATFDVTFNSDGSLNYAAETGATPYTITKFYNQPNNGTSDLNSLTIAFPVFSKTGGPSAPKPNATFGVTGTDRHIKTSPYAAVANPNTTLIVAMTDNGRSSEGAMVSVSSNARIICFNPGATNDNNWGCNTSGTPVCIAPAADSVWHLGQFVQTAGNNGALKIDTGSFVTGAVGTPTYDGSGNFWWGAMSNGNVNCNMQSVLLGVWASDLTTSAGGLYTNIHNFWNW